MLHDLSKLKIYSSIENNKDYHIVHYPDHPRKNNLGNVSLPLLLLENKIGRYLEDDEVVCFRDGDSQNRSDESLYVLSKEDYCRYHNLLRYKSPEIIYCVKQTTMSPEDIIEKFKDQYLLHNIARIKSKKFNYKDYSFRIYVYPEHPNNARYNKVTLPELLLENKINRILKPDERLCFKNGDLKDVGLNNLDFLSAKDLCRYINLLSYKSEEVTKDINDGILSAKEIVDKYRNIYPLHNLDVIKNKTRMDNKGYLVLNYKYHPAKYNNINYHRIVAENKINDYLKSDDEIHHLDENKLNNDPDNLIIMSKNEHMNLHLGKDIDIDELERLIKEGKLSYKEIADMLGININTFYDRTKHIRGDVKRTNYTEKKKKDKNYYKPSFEDSVCEMCGEVYVKNIEGQKYCSDRCRNLSHRKNDLSYREFKTPTKEELEKLVLEKSLRKIASDYGVTDTTIGKWCKKYRIQLPPKGHWGLRENLS